MIDTPTGGRYCVLLCAYNGANYLAEQLDSIVRQDTAPASVVFFDDGSSDNTVSIARRFVGVLPMVFVQLAKRRGGAAGAFDAILSYAVHSPDTYDAYVLCDQDDIWEPFKASRLLDRLSRVPAGVPALVHSELWCFGESSNGRGRLHQSLGHVRCESTPARPLQTLIFENVVVGASTAFNRALLELAIPMPLAAFMHDWWLAIACVAHGGELLYLPEPLTRYRIHRKSTVGQAGNFMHALPRRLKALRGGAGDPWLRIVGQQLAALPFGQGSLPNAYFEPLLTEGRSLFQRSNILRRFQAWHRLLQHRIWSAGAKDTYYKTRLFTDYVV